VANSRLQQIRQQEITKLGKSVFYTDESDLYSRNITPSCQVLSSMRDVTQLADDNKIIYYAADESDFAKDWVASKKQSLDFDVEHDAIFWIRANRAQTQGHSIVQWPLVNRSALNNFYYTDKLGTQTIQAYVVETSDGQIEHAPNKRNTGYAILRFPDQTS